MPTQSRGVAAKTATKIRRAKKAKTDRPAFTPYPETTTKTVKDVQTSRTNLPTAWQISQRAFELVRLEPKLFIGITLVYGFLAFLLVQGLSAGATVAQIRSLFGPHAGIVASSIGVFSTMIDTFGAGSGASGGIYQFLLLIIGSLALIWAFRQVLDGKRLVTVRDAYYRGMYPFVPFLLILLVIGLELVPLIIGAGLYNLMVTQGVTVGIGEDLALGAIFAAAALFSFYLISSTFLALYVVTEPNALPMESMQLAKSLVRGRRLAVFRKVLFMPFAIFVAGLVVLIPTILLLPMIAQWIYLLATILSVLAMHAYMYTLYGSLVATIDTIPEETA